MLFHRLKAKDISYGSKRNLKDIKYVVIHYTGNRHDTAKSNAQYFHNGNDREAGAHFFVDQKGICYRSIPMNLIAYSVGGDQRSGARGEATYYNKCKNANSVSIELCDLTIYSSDKQIAKVKKLLKYIRKHTGNDVKVIRHWDVNGKTCPGPYAGNKNKMWECFIYAIGETN